MRKVLEMDYCTLSGDIISYTSLEASDRKILIEKLEDFLIRLDAKYAIFSRIIKGDYIECVIPNSEEGLKIALIIKSYIKSLSVLFEKTPETPRFKLFKTHGIRIAIGFGELDRYDPINGVMDGEAIYYSGRAISGNTTYDKKRINIKSTLFFTSGEKELNANFEVILNLLDVLLAKATARQCEVLYLKLLGFTEAEISDQLEIGQSAVNQHSTSVGWTAIQSAVQYFNKKINNYGY